MDDDEVRDLPPESSADFVRGPKMNAGIHAGHELYSVPAGAARESVGLGASHEWVHPVLLHHVLLAAEP
jgi:hypothetical protein